MEAFRQMQVLDHGMQVIAEERNRQFAKLGYTIDRDTQYRCHELECAAAVYATPPHLRTESVMAMWPWDAKFWRPGPDTPEGRSRDLAKAGALIAAAISQLALKTPFDEEPNHEA